MSSTFTMYGRQLLLRAVYTPDVYTALSTLEFALTRNVAPANATVAALIEPTPTEYVRQPYTLTSTYWAPSGFGEIYNTLKITWPQVVTVWGMISGWALVEPVSGQCVAVGSVMESYQAIPGMIPYLDPGTVMLGIYD